MDKFVRKLIGQEINEQILQNLVKKVDKKGWENKMKILEKQNKLNQKKKKIKTK